MSAGILLARHGSLSIEARPDGLYAVTIPGSIRLSDIAQWPDDRLNSPDAVQAALQLSHLVELGLAEESVEFLRVSYTHFPVLFREGFTFPMLWSDWSPFTLSIRAEGAFSERGFRFSAVFRLGDSEVDVERAGRYVRRTGQSETWLLDEVTFALLQYLESSRTQGDPWIDFAFVKGHASELCAEMDDCLRNNEVIFPAGVRAARIPGGIRGAVEPLIDGVSEEVFRRAFIACSAIVRPFLLRLPSGAWGHLIFDDHQLAFLNAIKASGGLAAPEPPRAPMIEGLSGRTGVRRTEIDSHLKAVPVRLHSQPSLPTAESPPGRGYTVYDREIRSMRRSRLEALVACVYTSRGFQVVLTPEGAGLGAAAVAVRDAEVWLVRVEAEPAGRESLQALARMRAAYRRIIDRPYRVALIVKSTCSPQLEWRARALEAELMDGVHLIDEVEARSISYEDILQAESRRCRSMLEAVECLQVLLAGHLMEELE